MILRRPHSVLFLLASVLLSVLASPRTVLAVEVDIIRFNGTSSEICNFAARPIFHNYSLLVRSTFLGERTCTDVEWRFIENGNVTEFQSNSSDEIVSRAWNEHGMARIEVHVDDCGNFTGSGSTSMDITVGPVPPLTISGPSDICPSETRTFLIAPLANATSYTWGAGAAMSINGGGTVLANTAATQVSVTGPPPNVIAPVFVEASANYPSGGNYPNCGSSPSRRRTLTLLRSQLATPGGILGPGRDLCPNDRNYTASFSTQAIAGAGSYEWEVVGTSVRGTTGGPFYSFSASRVGFPGNFTIRVRATNRCGAASGWVSSSFRTLSEFSPQCRRGGGGGGGGPLLQTGPEVGEH
ncbi:MAG: hypothetical protein AAF604_09240 [Acidobacteriota bacterium]